MDDIIVTGSSTSYIHRFNAEISKKFSLKDLGPLSFFLGIEVTPTRQGIHLNQTKYLSDLLHKYKMEASKPTTTPMIPHPPLTKQPHEAIIEESDYRAIIGSLQYLTLTRPDIAYSVNKLSQYLTHPTATHWTALKRLLCYLQGTLHFGIQIAKTTPLSLHAFCDADWAGDTDDYISTSG